MVETIKSGIAMLKTLESWDVDHIYGIPGGSINSLVYALRDEETAGHIRYIHVRHEEVGALAAVSDGRVTGKIGVAFGSAGPGATHLYQGVYDAKMDKVPTLFIVGQVGQAQMNMDFFQEQDEAQLFGDGAVYNRTVMTAESLPHVVDEAVRQAYVNHEPAVVVIPNDLADKEIPADGYYSAAANFRKAEAPAPTDEQVDDALTLIKQAKKPILYIGQGVRGAADEAMELSQKLQLPIAYAALAKDVIPYDFPALLGSAMRVASKPANEAMAETDLILFVGSNFPFAEILFNPNAKFIQIDSNPAVLGKRHKTEVAMWADAKKALRKLNNHAEKAADSDWYRANIANADNWRDYNEQMMNKTDGELRFEPVFKEINRIATDDALFSIDVGDVTQNSVRLIKNTGKQRWYTSGLFATMGSGLPGAIAAQLSFPDKQVFSLAGDGAESMVMQDLITENLYHLPIINVVFKNEELGFIVDEQEDDEQRRFGVSLGNVDFSKVAEAHGVTGISVTKQSELQKAFDEALEITKRGEPVLIDVQITGERPIPVEKLELDPDKFTDEAISRFRKRYYAQELKTLKEFEKES
ncbi:pyruvate oxidase [Secundilactobacillus malefermentans]|uniref:pyruvate oxidase n=1 Tax=Secundilactobacillus malefermentans TaxID=176292 RepID=UPI0011C788EF|nr:pyruvate oxidase [Secundilactobacillus malefermentans]QEA31553.1 pyruvate oxidase [Secundilactobacillus malefermentans]